MEADPNKSRRKETGSYLTAIDLEADYPGGNTKTDMVYLHDRANTRRFFAIRYSLVNFYSAIWYCILHHTKVGRALDSNPPLQNPISKSDFPVPCYYGR